MVNDEEFLGLRREVRQFLKDALAQGRYVPSPDAWLLGYDEAFSREVAQRGWVGMAWSPEYGGRGASYRARFVVTEELLRAGAPVAAHWIADRQIGPSIFAYGSERLKREFLPRIASGEVQFCLGMSEPESGSDLASVSTRATQVPGGWKINGQKIWSSNAHRASFGYVLARTSQGTSRHDGLTEFVVAMHADGIDVRPIIDLRGEAHFNEIFFDDVFVPDHHVIGAVGNGWDQVIAQLAFERGGPERVLSTYPVLAAALRLEDSISRSELALATSLSKLGPLRQLAWNVAERMDRGESAVVEAATLKYLGTQFEVEVVELVRQAVGSVATSVSGVLYDVWSAGVAASPGFTIRGGTSEILLTILSREVIGSRT